MALGREIGGHFGGLCDGDEMVRGDEGRGGEMGRDDGSGEMREERRYKQLRG